MTTAAPPKPVSKRRPNARDPAALQAIAQTRLPQPAPTGAPTPQGRGPTTLFRVPFASAMSDGDVALLARALDLTTHMHAKLRQSPTSPLRRRNAMKLLVIASEPISADRLHEVLGGATDDAEIIVPAPARHRSALHFWRSDADEAIRRPERMPREAIAGLDDAASDAHDDSGEGDPVTAGGRSHDLLGGADRAV